MINCKKTFTLAEGATHVASFNKKYSFGFTLAEVLITLGIIGVVAAMTMPTLIQNHQKTVYVTGVKKAINIVSNMLRKMQADDEASEIAYTTLISDGLCARILDETNGENKNGCEDIYGNISVFENLIPKYLNVVKTCKNDECDINYKLQCSFNSATSNTLNCSNNVGKITTDVISWGQDLLGVYTADGMIYYFIPSYNSLVVAVDTNGIKSPNQHGRDLFYLTFCMTQNGKFMASGANSDWACAGSSGSDSNLNTQLMRNSPLYRIINDGWKMNY